MIQPLTVNDDPWLHLSEHCVGGRGLREGVEVDDTTSLSLRFTGTNRCERSKSSFGHGKVQSRNDGGHEKCSDGREPVDSVDS